MKKVAIIGANSYIARNIIYIIEKNGKAELSLYDKADQHVDKNSNYQSVNILSKESVASIDMRVDIIFLFAGKTGASGGFDDPDTFIDVNEKSLLYILNEYRRQHSAAKIIFPSTRLLYDQNSDATESDMAEVLKTVYAVNKYACEQYLKMYHHVFGVKYSIFRICIPYGTLVPGASSYGTIDFMLKRARAGQNISLYGSGKVRRTLTYIEDLCNAIIFATEHDECNNNVFNVGGDNYSLKEMAELIAKKYRVEVEYIPYPKIARETESGDTVFNSDKLDSIIGLERKMKFEDWICTAT